MPGVASAENCGIHSCSADTGVDVPVMQVVDWVSCWRCLKFSSSPEFVDLPVCTETGGFQRGFGGDVGLGIFRAPLGRPGVERQFSEPLDDEEFFVVEGSC